MGLFKKIRESVVGDLTSADLPPTKQEQQQWERERKSAETGKEGKR